MLSIAQAVEEYKQVIQAECLVGSCNTPTQLPKVEAVFPAIIDIGVTKPDGYRAVWTQHDGTEFQSKFSNPKPDPVTGKIAKYKTPYGAERQVFKPLVCQDVWEAIASRHGLDPKAIWNWGVANNKCFSVPFSLKPNTPIKFFWEWASQCNLPLFITEGAKKSNSLMAGGYLAVAVAGVYNGHIVTKEGNRKTGVSLVANLIPLVHAKRKVTLVFDADEKAETRANVSRALKELAGALTEAGATVSRLEWSLETYAAKGIDDLIALEGYDVVDRLQGRRLVGTFVDAVKQQRVDAVQNWKQRRDQPAHDFHQIQNAAPAIPTQRGSGRYISATEAATFATQVTSGIGSAHVLDAPMGAGKTSTVCKQVIQQWRDLHGGKGVILYLAPRLTILAQAAVALGLAKHDARATGVFEVAVTLESLHAYAPLWESGALPLLVIADEWSQALSQLHAGATGTQTTPQQMGTVRSLFAAVAQRGTFLISEDQITNHDVSYCGLPLGAYFLFDREVPARKFDLVNGKAAIATRIGQELEAGGSVCHVSDSNRQCRGFALLVVEAGWVQKDQTLVIDSETPPAIRERFMRSPMEYVVSHGIRFLACSPSAQSGVSLDDTAGHFTHMTFSLAHLPFRSGRQLLGRLRSSVPATGWLANSGVTFTAQGASLTALAIPQNIVGRALTLVRDTMKEAGDSLPFTARSAAQSKLAALEDPWSTASAITRAIATSQSLDAYGQHDLKRKIVDDLKAKGHTVGQSKHPIPDEVKALIDTVFGTKDSDLEQTVDDGLLDEVRAAFRAGLDVADLTVGAALEIRRASDSTYEDRERAEKAISVHNFPALAAAGRFDSQEGQLALSRDKFLKKTELLHLIQHGSIKRTAAKEIQVMTDSTRYLDVDSHVLEIFKLDPKSRKAAMLEATGIMEVYRETGLTWSEANPGPIVEAVRERSLQLAGPIASVLRLFIHEEQGAVEITNKLLRKLGFTIGSTRPRAGSDAARGRVYFIADADSVDRVLALRDYADRDNRDYFKSFASPEARQFVKDAIFAHIRANELPFVISINADKQLVAAAVYRDLDGERPWTETTPATFGAALYEKHRQFMTTHDF